MTYRALYRVWRPSRFDELVGQDTIAQTLRNALRQDRLSHAYLFTGGRGTGKTSTAKILAKAVNCLNLQEGEPCNTCAHCVAILEDRFMDVIEIDAASNRGIDEMRQLKENVQFVPSQGTKKVYIIDEVHMLTTEAFNALLKTLEEPPAHVLFILATTDPQKIPATILSRTQRFDFRRIPSSAITEQLHKIAVAEKIQISDAALDMIAQASNGGLRDAVSLLDQASAFSEEGIDEDLIAKLLGRPSPERMQALFKAMAQKDYSALFEASRQALREAGDPASFQRAVSAALRDLFMTRVFKEETLPKEFAPFTIDKLEALLSQSLQAENDIKRLPDGDLVVETSLIRMSLILADEGTRANTGSAGAPAPSQTAAPASPPLKTSKAIEKPPEPSLSAGQSSDRVQATSNLPTAWEKVMQIVKDQSVRTHALLRQASPTGLKEDGLHLSFPRESEFHFRQMQEKAQKDCLQAAVHRVFGTATKIQLQLEEELLEESSNAADDAYDLIAASKEIFGDVPMEIKDEPDPFQ